MIPNRSLLSVPFILACIFAPSAQAVIVNQAGYSATDNIAFQWDALATGYKAPIAGATRILGNDDDTANGPINLGFNFDFFAQYNYSYNQIYITSNGLLTFGSSSGLTYTTPTTTSNLNGSLSSETSELKGSPAIAVAWDDWTTTPNGTDGVYYATLGEAGSRRFVVEWHDTQHYGASNTSPVSFEAVLYEGSNAIEFRYLDMDTGNNATALGLAATVGLRDFAADKNGRSLEWSNNQALLANSSSVLFAPVPLPASYAVMMSGLAGLGLLSRRRKKVAVC